jgi:hypothetical protein
MSLKAAMKKKGKEERGVILAGRRGSGSRPEERGSRPPIASAPASHGAIRGARVDQESERGATDLSPKLMD